MTLLCVLPARLWEEFVFVCRVAVLFDRTATRAHAWLPLNPLAGSLVLSGGMGCAFDGRNWRLLRDCQRGRQGRPWTVTHNRIARLLIIVETWSRAIGSAGAVRANLQAVWFASVDYTARFWDWSLSMAWL